jgi:hypothetical protein
MTAEPVVLSHREDLIVQTVLSEQHAAMLAYLNSLLDADSDALYALIEHRVPVNQTLADHPAAVLYDDGSGAPPTYGMLGVINGMLQVMGFPALGARYDDNNRPVHFGVYIPAPSLQNPPANLYPEDADPPKPR